MPYELQSEDQLTIFTISSYFWQHLRTLAGWGGWQPQGTLAPDNWSETMVWPKVYDTRDGQWVTKADALAMAHSLEAKLDDIPDVQTAPFLLILTTDPNNPNAFNLKEYESNRAYYGIPEDMDISIMSEDEYNKRLHDTPPTILIAGPNFQQSPIDVFSGINGKAFINRFIDFAHLGGFAIY